MKLSDLLILESLTSAYEYKVLTDNYNSFECEFVTSAGKRIFVYLKRWLEIDEGSYEWELGFSSMIPYDNGVLYKFDATGDGDEFRVFATVMKIVRDFLANRNDVAQIEFTADKSEKSRASLYTRLLKRFAPAGWTPETFDQDSDQDVYFILKKEHDETD